MTVTTDPVVLNEWIVCGFDTQIPVGGRRETKVLGQPITISHAEEGKYVAHAVDEEGREGRELPIEVHYQHLFTTLGTPTRPIPMMEEFYEPDRQVVGVGAIGVQTSPFRVVENFLDMAHFPFVHTDILGSPDQTEVLRYKMEHRKDVDEVWATGCEFFQPAASQVASGGQISHYTYRIMSPFSCVLYKTNALDSSRVDAIGLFVQPLDETHCFAYTPQAFYDPESTAIELQDFQQTVFMQDRLILENQRPKLLPLEAGAELPTRADASSMMFRRWLKDMGVQFGIDRKQAA